MGKRRRDVNSTPLVLSPSRNYYLGAVADMNGDGLPDLVLSDGSLISILYNQGSRGFGTPLPSGRIPASSTFLPVKASTRSRWWT